MALAGVLVILVIGVGAAIAWLDSRAGKAWLEATINDAAVGTARVTGIGGSLPFHPTVESVELTDAAGSWGRLHDIQLDIAPLDILVRRVTVQRLAAADVEIDRLPQAGPEPAEPEQPSSLSLELPRLPVGIDIQQFVVGSLSLPPDILGEPTVWTINAAAHLIGRDLGLNLQVAEVGSSPLHADVLLELADSHVGAQASVDDPRGLLLHQALGEALPLQVRLVDDPNAPQDPADWRGRLTTTIGDRTRIDSSLRLAATGESHQLEMQGTLEGNDLLPPTIAPILGDTVKFNIAARETAGERIALDTLALEAATFEASGTASYQMPDQRLDSSLRVTIPEFAPFSDLAGQPLAGTAVLDLTAHGPLDTMRAEAVLDANRLSFGATAVDNIRAKLEAEAAPDRGYALDGAGSFAGIQSGEAPLPANLGKAVEWRLRGRSDAKGERIALTEFDVSSAGLNLSADGSLDRATQDVKGTARLQLDEAQRFAELAGPGLKGHGQITADLAGKISDVMTVRIDGGFDDLATGIPAADALLGGRLRLAAAAQREESGRIEIESASLTAAAARVTAQGAIDPAANQLNGELTASADDLAVLRRAGLQTKGSLRLDAQLSGSVSAPAIDARLAGADIAWQATQIDRIAARLRADMAGAPSGNLTAELKSRDLVLRLDGQADLSSDRKTLNVPKLQLRSGTSVVETRLKTALDTLLTSGQITANVPDLAPFSSLAGLDLGGRLNLNLALTAPRGEQAAKLAFNANELSAGAAGAEPITVRRLSANGALSDLLRRPSGRIDIGGEQISAASARLDNVRFAARSSQPNRFSFDGTTTGEFNGPLNFTTAGNVALDGGTTRVTLTRLTGKLADTPLTLQRPLRVTARGADLGLTDLALAVGDGTIEGMVKRTASRLDVDLTGRRLPVGLGAALAGRPEISGALDLQARLSGPAAQPRGKLTLEANDLRAGPTRQGQPVIGINAEANIAPSDVNIDAAVTAGGNQLLSASGAVPVVFGPAPGAVALAKKRPLRLNVRGDGELSTLADFLPLAGDRLAGVYRLALDASGPAAQPQVTGELSLDRGRYENRASGLVIDALALQVTADRDRVVLRRLTATDGAKGTLEGNGTVLLNTGGTPAADATINIAGFRALRRSDATLSASGTTTVKGPMDALGIIANITVDEAEFFIPDPPPTSATKIPVTVIDSATGRILERPEEPAATSEGAMSLDVGIHVPGRTFIRGRGLDSEWQGDIRVQGTSAAPELTGALKVTRGKFAFFGKDLELTRGTVAFTGGSKIEPDLDVLAETTTDGTTFQVGAAGTPDNLKIKLSSVPPLPEDEILSRLLFGREMTRLTPAQGLQLAQAAATLSSGGPGVLDKLRGKLGLDTLSIGGGSGNDSAGPNAGKDAKGDAGGTEDAGVSAGKYVANGVYVGVEQRFSGETRSKVEVEVLPNVNVETTAGTRGESVGVIWKKDY